MKRELFDFLNTDLQFIKGVGPVLATRFDDVLGGRRVLDFMLHTPAYIRARDVTKNVLDAVAGDVITIPLLVKSHRAGGVFRGRRRPTQILCADKMGNTVVIQFFNVNFLDYWLKKLPVGDWRMVSGKLERGGRATINHPDFIEEMQNADKIPSIQAIYPAGEGLTQKTFANVRDQIFNILPDKIAGETDDNVREFFDALRHVHYPQSDADLMPNSTYMAKLAYWELLAHQSAIVISRRNRADVRNRRVVRPKKYELLERFYSALPFALTGAQTRTLGEIFDDMSRDVPMMRLVQGDVGSGKTIVALAAAVKMAETGAQTALLAPTDTLAQQHYAKIKPLCDKIGIVCDILTGRDKGAPRREKLVSLRSGRTKIVVGTHALFSDDVEYKDLGLVIVDEQHRFGVSQREALRSKGANPDLLALSATPIPRTLSMTIYGDMDVSIINEKPAGRLPIITTKLPVARVGELVARLRVQIDNGAKVFWVCPLVEQSEVSDLTAVNARYDDLKKFFPTAGLVHGQMEKRQRDAVMAEFADDNSDMKILVATTVIEVGIDVPRATIIVIENAERFGLAALHQLRGRVGRGNQQSYCILLYGRNISEDGLKRLDVLTETDDGFAIAEQDLIMRGTGELLGTRQSGWINYHFVDYARHRDLFKLAASAARDMVDVDAWTRDLMFIFDRGVTISA
ncbi:MAG TPA: ATP-dependent DNA helicase RecG [Candidatus Enterousia intestinigallinarum]|uniref:ATP-dependent DNA helicase RecG n=1 Tax=Candidatus Enterousia intestinigallinarum TaxID=2840790 RepID=A0A9D1FF98_9PROT|nr:ATP-dependent DNA helicase RecG [Candidatus Enterousia intestinigallinarum]